MTMGEKKEMKMKMMTEMVMEESQAREMREVEMVEVVEKEGRREGAKERRSEGERRDGRTPVKEGRVGSTPHRCGAVWPGARACH